MKRLILAALAAIATFAAHAATTVPPSLINPAGSTAGQAIVSTGPSTAPGWSKVSVAGLAAQAANTVLANVTASSASPTAFAMPSCSTSTSALQYTSGTGFTCFTGSAPLASPTFTGTVTITNTTGNSLIVNGSGNSGSGAQFFLQGNGATTPNKYIRAFNGAFQIVNSANSATPMSMDDAGNMTLTGTLTATGITGTTSGAAPAASDVGSANVQNFSSVNITTSNTAQNLTSLSVGAGVWDITCNVIYSAAATTTTNAIVAGSSTTSATLPSAGNYSQMTANFPVNAANSLICPVQRINVSSTQTVYLVGQVIFGTSTVSASGFLRALRVH